MSEKRPMQRLKPVLEPKRYNLPIPLLGQLRDESERLGICEGELVRRILGDYFERRDGRAA